MNKADRRHNKAVKETTAHARPPGKPAAKTLETGARDGLSPLTPVQAGMIFESTLAGQPHVNLEQIVVYMSGDPVDSAAMRRAWQRAMDRHPALRMVIDWTDEAGPCQRAVHQARVELDDADDGTNGESIEA